jgi:hypothetical protein
MNFTLQLVFSHFVAKRLDIASNSRERDRRPTLKELDKILEYFGERLKRRPSSIPMRKIIGFAIFSTRRWRRLRGSHGRIVMRKETASWSAI